MMRLFGMNMMAMREGGSLPPNEQTSSSSQKQSNSLNRNDEEYEEFLAWKFRNSKLE
jgi:hypothetical protein